MTLDLDKPEIQTPALDPKKLSERLLDIGRGRAAHLQEPFLSNEHGDLLYDENGLPE